jgi:hypothetical protein
VREAGLVGGGVNDIARCGIAGESAAEEFLAMKKAIFFAGFHSLAEQAGRNVEIQSANSTAGGLEGRLLIAGSGS